MTTVQQWVDAAASAHEDRHGLACDCDEQRSLAALRAVLTAGADLSARGEALDARRGGTGSIVAQQNEGRGQGYREAVRLIESAIAAALGVTP